MSESIRFYNSPAGYFGALIAIVLSILLATGIINIPLPNSYLMFAVIGLVFAVMFIAELSYLRKYHPESFSKFAFASSKKYRLKSAVYRFIALLIPIALFYVLTHTVWYYSDSKLFRPALEFFELLLGVYAVFGIFYIYLTLNFRGASRYEYGDYAILTLLLFKSIAKILNSDDKATVARYKVVLQNRRISKVLLVYVVNFFFSTLMCRFMLTEFEALKTAFGHLMSSAYTSYPYGNKLYVWHQIIFNSIFLIDVSIALIGYTVASRWLQNRTRSVDGTMLGWYAALICYPPFNDMVSKLFFGGVGIHDLNLSETLLTVIVCLTLTMYMLYVWGTVALGFRFSNLTNRGIVTSGPYRYVRHPAYFAKNISWWLESPAAFSNILLAVSLLFWNIVYTIRAITEEKHLSKDASYEEYKVATKYRFIPGIY